MTELKYTQEDMDRIEKENDELRKELGEKGIDVVVVSDEMDELQNQMLFFDCGSMQVNRSELACRNISTGHDPCLTCKYEQLKKLTMKE